MKRVVAVKLLRRELLCDAEMVGRFQSLTLALQSLTLLARHVKRAPPQVALRPLH